MPGESDVSRSGRLTAVRQTVLASNVCFLRPLVGSCCCGLDDVFHP